MFVNGVKMRERLSIADGLRINQYIDAIRQTESEDERIFLTARIVGICTELEEVTIEHLRQVNAFLEFHRFKAKEENLEKLDETKAKLVRFGAMCGLEYGKTSHEFLSGVTFDELQDHWNAMIDRKIEHYTNMFFAQHDGKSLKKQIEVWRDSKDDPEPAQIEEGEEPENIGGIKNFREFFILR